ncbi:MAG: cytochrome c [Proteobacteria bacterium]|nr:cytochrome c [Pseudomonadota bacterium]
MREKWAIRIVLLTGLLVLMLAITFALRQSPTETPGPTASGEQVPAPELLPDPQRIEAGRQVYVQQRCARCHSIAGKGNLRYPLDGVGEKRSAEELRNWIIGADVLQGVLLGRVFRLKQAHKELPSDDLDALVSYMQSLR